MFFMHFMRAGILVYIVTIRMWKGQKEAKRDLDWYCLTWRNISRNNWQYSRQKTLDKYCACEEYHMTQTIRNTAVRLFVVDNYVTWTNQYSCPTISGLARTFAAQGRLNLFPLSAINMKNFAHPQRRKQMCCPTPKKENVLPGIDSLPLLQILLPSDATPLHQKCQS